MITAKKREAKKLTRIAVIRLHPRSVRTEKVVGLLLCDGY